MKKPEKDDRTVGERIADNVAAFGGSWRFISSALMVIVVWVVWNATVTLPYQFDPFPFILLNLFLSLIAAFQAPFLLMSQRRAEKKSEKAHRRTLRGIRRLIQKDIEIEKEILSLLKSQQRVGTN